MKHMMQKLTIKQAVVYIFNARDLLLNWCFLSFVVPCLNCIINTSWAT